MRAARFALFAVTSAVLLARAAAAASPPITLVVCAPGYPGSTEEAQPAMDALAAAAAAAAGWQPGELHAVYFETEQGGLDRLAQSDAALVLAPLPFYLEHHEALRLAPRLQAVRAGGEADERWALYAAKGKVVHAEDLDGWELVSIAAWSRRFVRGPALAWWGQLPATVKYTSSGAVLSALRRAAAGEKVAVLLDGRQAASIAELPLASQLDRVHRSAPMPDALLCAVGSRLAGIHDPMLVAALPRLGATEAGAAALAGVRLSGFVPVDEKALAAARAAFIGAHE